MNYNRRKSRFSLPNNARKLCFIHFLKILSHDLFGTKEPRGEDRKKVVRTKVDTSKFLTPYLEHSSKMQNLFSDVSPQLFVVSWLFMERPMIKLPLLEALLFYCMLNIIWFIYLFLQFISHPLPEGLCYKTDKIKPN